MMGKLPFLGRVFWKVLIVVTALVAIVWVVIVRLTEYAITPTDYFGTTLSTVIFSYLVHLWLLPGEESSSDSDPPPDEQ